MGNRPQFHFSRWIQGYGSSQLYPLSSTTFVHNLGSGGSGSSKEIYGFCILIPDSYIPCSAFLDGIVQGKSKGGKR